MRRDRAGAGILRVEPHYLRPTKVETLLGDPTTARQKLDWVPEIAAQQMCKVMVTEDLWIVRRHPLLRTRGYDMPLYVES